MCLWLIHIRFRKQRQKFKLLSWAFLIYNAALIALIRSTPTNNWRSTQSCFIDHSTYFSFNQRNVNVFGYTVMKAPFMKSHKYVIICDNNYISP